VRLRLSRRDDQDFDVRTHAREIVAYWEGDRAFLFDAAWGARRPELYVPNEALWDQVVPEWMKGRRAAVIRRLAKRSGHRIVETDEGYEWNKGIRELRPIASEAEAQAIATAFLERMPFTIERTSQTERGWRFELRNLDPERTPDFPRRVTLLVRRDNGDVEFE
jgi:hypothetical protein